MVERCRSRYQHRVALSCISAARVAAVSNCSRRSSGTELCPQPCPTECPLLSLPVLPHLSCQRSAWVTRARLSAAQWLLLSLQVCCCVTALQPELLSLILMYGFYLFGCGGSVLVAHGLSGCAACGNFPDQGWNPWPLRIGRQILNQLDRQQSSHITFLKDLHVIPVFTSLTEKKKTQRPFSLFMKTG